VRMGKYIIDAMVKMERFRTLNILICILLYWKTGEGEVHLHFNDQRQRGRCVITYYPSVSLNSAWTSERL